MRTHPPLRAGWPRKPRHLAGAGADRRGQACHMNGTAPRNSDLSDGTPIAAPPESIEQAALTIHAAADLMADVGFVAFRTPPDAELKDSCLMAMIRDAPTRRHFDPETVSYWVIESGHGQTEVVDHGAQTPISRPFSWGRIRLVDRLGKRNSFVSFGGWLTGERVGADALLLIFRSSAPI